MSVSVQFNSIFFRVSHRTTWLLLTFWLRSRQTETLFSNLRIYGMKNWTNLHFFQHLFNWILKGVINIVHTLECRAWNRKLHNSYWYIIPYYCHTIEHTFINSVVHFRWKVSCSVKWLSNGVWKYSRSCQFKLTRNKQIQECKFGHVFEFNSKYQH